MNSLCARLVKRMRWTRSPNRLRAQDLFPYDLIAHFSYHKCLTFYYKRIMQRLSAEFGFDWEHLNVNVRQFHAKATARGNAFSRVSKRVLSVNNSSQIEWDALPPYRASHFVRDPRDLLVSGYRYHLWTNEPWCIAPDFSWKQIVTHSLFKYIEPATDKRPHDISYQRYLNTLAVEQGFILEMIWRESHFREMRAWNFQNPHTLEMRYEDIIGNEEESFARLFEHYGFHPKLAARGVTLAHEYSLKRQSTGETKHLRKGSRRQWTEEFTPLVVSLFKQAHGDLLIQLGYERDLDW